MCDCAHRAVSVERLVLRRNAVTSVSARAILPVGLLAPAASAGRHGGMPATATRVAAFGSCLRDRLQSRVFTCHGRPIAEAGVRTPCCQAKGETMASDFTRVHGRVLHEGASGPPLRLQVLDAGDGGVLAESASLPDGQYAVDVPLDGHEESGLLVEARDDRGDLVARREARRDGGGTDLDLEQLPADAETRPPRLLLGSVDDVVRGVASLQAAEVLPEGSSSVLDIAVGRLAWLDGLVEPRSARSSATPRRPAPFARRCGPGPARPTSRPTGGSSTVAARTSRGGAARTPSPTSSTTSSPPTPWASWWPPSWSWAAPSSSRPSWPPA